MIIPTATVWAFSALIIVMIIVVVYFIIFFTILYIIGWGISRVLRPIGNIMFYE